MVRHRRRDRGRLRRIYCATRNSSFIGGRVAASSTASGSLAADGRQGTIRCGNTTMSAKRKDREKASSWMDLGGPARPRNKGEEHWFDQRPNARKLLKETVAGCDIETRMIAWSRSSSFFRAHRPTEGIRERPAARFAGRDERCFSCKVSDSRLLEDEDSVIGSASFVRCVGL